MRTLLWFIYFWVYLLLCIPGSLYVKHLEKKGDMERLERVTAHIVRNWASRLLKAAGVRVTVEGAENLPKDPFVLVANHQGYFDIPIMLACVGKPRGLVAKIELSRLPFIRTWMKHLHCLFVDRSSLKAGAQTIADGAKMVSEGNSLTIFPEGTRSKGGPIGEFKAGAFRIASKAGAPVVPVTIDGSYRVMEGNGMWIRPASVKVTVHCPIETRNMSREELRGLPERVQQIVQEAL